MVETWQVLLATGGVLTPIILAAMARDRSLFMTISNVKTDINRVKDDMAGQVKTAEDRVHERVNRVRDEYVRRDDLEGHLLRWEKQFDDMRVEMRRNNDNMNAQLSEIVKMLRKA